MVLIRIQAVAAPGELTEPQPIEIHLSNEQARGFMEFITCLATKVDVLMPAVLAIVGCITSLASSAKGSGK